MSLEKHRRARMGELAPITVSNAQIMFPDLARKQRKGVLDGGAGGVTLAPET